MKYKVCGENVIDMRLGIFDTRLGIFGGGGSEDCFSTGVGCTEKVILA